MSPSSYKDNVCRITQGWPTYTGGKRHYGIDICCGIHHTDKMLCVEDSVVIETFEGNGKKSGYVKLLGLISEKIIIYKHAGKFKVKEKDKIKSGDIIASPNYTNTDSLHLHFEVWNNEKNLNPIEYLMDVQPYLKYELSKNFGMYEYYYNTDKKMLDKMITLD